MLNSPDPFKTTLVTFLRYKNLHLLQPCYVFFTLLFRIIYSMQKPSLLCCGCLVSSKSFGDWKSLSIFGNLSRIYQPDIPYLHYYCVTLGTLETVCKALYIFTENTLTLPQNAVIICTNISYLFSLWFIIFSLI